MSGDRHDEEPRARYQGVPSRVAAHDRSGSEDSEVGVHLHDELAVRKHADVAIGL